MSRFTREVRAVFAAGGPLAGVLEGFGPRPQQLAMAEAVAGVLEVGQNLVCEAGTGTGKTFAYLVPALLSGRPVLVSTGTRSLQDQLFHRDLPTVRKALAVPVRVALLKGRANYLCRYRLERETDALPLYDPRSFRQLERIRVWARTTRAGDVAELPDVPEDAPVWRFATSTTDNCLGQECPALSDCHLVRARRAAQEADLVVVNHHLLCADLALREDGFGELLPDAAAIIVDEAHQLPEVATQFFGQSLSSRQLADLAEDVTVAYRQEAGDVPGFDERVTALSQSLQGMRQRLDGEPRRAALADLLRDQALALELRNLAGSLAALLAALEPMAERGKELKACQRRCEQMAQVVQRVTGEVAEDQLAWAETFGRGFMLRLTPLDIAATLGPRLAARDAAWIFTSATLAVGESLDYFATRVGLTHWEGGRWESPFDFAAQALLYLPPGLPDPGARDYTAAVVEAMRPVLAASRGRAFLLFTSHRALREAAALLQGALPYPLLVQGDAPRNTLLERFRQTPHAVLLGTSSFWEGVDVRGEALSCVIIDKLPFASPDDPVFRAREAVLRRQGRNPFGELQLPQAVIALKQGAGRLIRDRDDRGVLVICDPRLRTRSYGRHFLASLPPMPVSGSLAEVQRFFSG